MVEKTCQVCKKKRSVGDFHYEASIDKELCGYCLYKYYKEKGITDGWMKTKASQQYKEEEV